MVMWLAALVFAAPALAAPAEAIREAAEGIVATFADELADASADAVAAQLERLAATCGDNAVQAARAVGPRAMAAMEQASAEDGPAVATLIARHGEAGLQLARQPENIKLFRQFGDDALTLLLAQTQPATAPSTDPPATDASDANSAVTARLSTATRAAAQDTQPPRETNWPRVIGLCIAVSVVWLALRIWLLLRQNRRRKNRP